MKTVTAVGEALLHINFENTKLAGISRVDAESASCDFYCGIGGKGMEKLFRAMGWELPGEKSSMEKLDGKLIGGHFILTGDVDPERLKVKSPDKKLDTGAEVECEFGTINTFACHRLELVGRKKKGFRRELRFKASLNDPDAMGKLEAYMEATGDGRGKLKVSYLPEPEQTTIPEVTAPDQQEVLEGVVEEIRQRRERTN